MTGRHLVAGFQLHGITHRWEWYLRRTDRRRTVVCFSASRCLTRVASKASCVRFVREFLPEYPVEIDGLLKRWVRP